MMEWLVGNCCELFGVTVQNWSLLFAGLLLGYIAVLVMTRHRNRPLL